MSRLLDPKVLLAIKNLSLAARTTIDGLMAGINKSRIKGEGLEFSQYRSYQPGDDLRQLDWKAYARSDRYYIRESEMETSISTRVVVDASASMNHTDNGYTKIEYAALLAASLAWLAAQQGDAVGLYIMQASRVEVLEPKRGYQHMNRLYHALEMVKAKGGSTAVSSYKPIFNGAPKRELIIYITDLHEKDQELLSIIDALSVMKHEVIVFHLLGQNEMTFDYDDYAALEDLETGSIIKINSRQDKKRYKENLHKYLAAIKAAMLGRDIFYRLLNTREPVEQALRDFLRQRSKLSA